MGAIHQNPRRPLHLAAVVLPLVDRASADRETGELNVEELEPAMLTDHAPTLADAGRNVGPEPLARTIVTIMANLAVFGWRSCRGKPHYRERPLDRLGPGRIHLPAR